MNKKVKRIGLVLWLLWVQLMCFPCLAQLTERPVSYHGSNHPGFSSARTLAVGDTIMLPFWDDFSSYTGQPDSTWWEKTGDVYVNTSLGLQPPTLGMATFDGLNSEGAPHNPNSNFVGPADSLTSRAIDLSHIAANLRSTVFLSFFWQIQGRGELPNEEDSLRLQFFTRDSIWVTQWAIKGGEDNLSEDFRHEFVAISASEFYHKGFRFRFQSFNKQTGPFDHWHIDYVYLNQNRSKTKNTYFDRAIATPPSSPLHGVYAIPPGQFRQANLQLAGPSSFEIYNLDDQLQPIEYNLRVKDTETGRVITTLEANRVVDPIPRGLERRQLVSSAINTEELAGFLGNKDSLVVELQAFLKTGDKHLISRIDPLTADTTYVESVNFRSNDTTSLHITFHDYTAWDDGTAEYSAGINQSRGQLAYKVAAPAQDTLTAIDIHFPRIAPFAEGQPLDIIVWKTLGNTNQKLEALQRVSVQYGTGRGGFVRYKLEKPLVVSDTFYIGYRQYTDNFVGIGLDKNNDTGNRVYYNAGTGWVHNDRTYGALLIRPVYENVKRRSVTSVADTQGSDLLIYPNPSSGIIHFSAMPEQLYITHISGWRIPPPLIQHHSAPYTIDLSAWPRGLYFVHYQHRKQWNTFKLILKHF